MITKHQSINQPWRRSYSQKKWRILFVALSADSLGPIPNSIFLSAVIVVIEYSVMFGLSQFRWTKYESRHQHWDEHWAVFLLLRTQSTSLQPITTSRNAKCMMHQVFCSHSLLLGICLDFQKMLEKNGDYYSLEKKTCRLSLSDFQKMSETGDYYSLEELARDDNLTLDPAVCGNITDEYMLVICIYVAANLDI